MLRPFDSKNITITKINLESIKKGELFQLYTAENQHINALQSERSRRSSHLLITPRINPNQSKHRAAFFMRNSIRWILRKNFRRMLSRLMIRKICFKLIKTKGKRDLERAFLTIREYTQQNMQKVINQLYHRQPQIRIFTSIFNKILAKPEKEVMSRIRNFTLRKKRFEHFVKCLFQIAQERLFKEGAGTFWSIIHLQTGRSKQKQSAASMICKWESYRIKSQLQQSLASIKDFKLSEECFEKGREKKEKDQKLLNNASNRKQTLAKLRQDLKATKLAIDQQKLAKNKVYQQHKKIVHTNKIEMAENVRKYEKQAKVQEVSYKQVQEQYNEWQRLLKIRKNIAQKGQGSQARCFQIYSKLLKDPESLVKQLQNYVPSLKADVSEFRENQICLFLVNLRMAKLVELYEKREPYNYEAEYYELQYQNNVLRQTIRCFLREKYEAFIAMRYWQNTRSLKSLDLG